MLGLLAIVALLFLLQRQAVRLWRDTQAPAWMRDVALLFLLFGCAFTIQMMFHEVSYSPVEYGLFFFLAGADVGGSKKTQRRTCRRYPIVPDPHARCAHTAGVRTQAAAAARSTADANVRCGRSTL